MAEMTRVQMTAEEFLELPEASQITELINGEVIVSPSGTLPHQALVLTVGIFLTQNAANGITVIAPMDVRLDEYNVVQPDVLWVRHESTQCVAYEDKYLIGAPELVVEILSPSTSKRDLGMKYELYERHGVREYWIGDAVAQFFQVFVNENGKFMRQGVYGAGETFTSRVLGIEVAVSKLLGVEK